MLPRWLGDKNNLRAWTVQLVILEIHQQGILVHSFVVVYGMATASKSLVLESFLGDEFNSSKASRFTTPQGSSITKICFHQEASHMADCKYSFHQARRSDLH
jgi:hypothetical protein